jgi:hypothetical protein
MPLFDVYVYNNPHNAWTYTRGYINAFQKLGMLGRPGDIVSWHNPNLQDLFSTSSQFIVMIGPEHHRTEIFGTQAKCDAIRAYKKATGKKLIGICYESSADPFGCAAWARAGQPWLQQNVHKYGSGSYQCYSISGMAEQFQCFDYVFTQDEVDMSWLRQQGVNAHWLPACVDADVFTPMVEKPANRAGFVGNVWWPRDELYNFYPFKFDVVSAPKAPFNDSNALDIARGLANAYNQFNIAINMRSPFAGVSMRTFELMACGMCPIIYHPAPDRTMNIGLFLGWTHVAWFVEWSSEDQKKIAGYYNHMVANYEQTRQHGVENRNFVLEKHTPVHRINEIVSKL